MSSPRARPPTYSIPCSLASAAARIEPTLPWCPATATRIGSFICACLSVSARAASSPTAVAASAVAPAETAFPRRRRRGKGSGHHLWVDVLFDRQTLAGQLFDRCLAAEVEAALAVDLDRLDHYLVADVAYLFHAFDAVVRELGDVHQAGQHLVEHEEARFASLLERLHKYLVGQALDLDIHLQRSDAVAGAGDLEVHVAEVVFDSLNVCEHSMLAFACDQAHGDAGHR